MLVTDMTSSLHTRAHPAASFSNPNIALQKEKYRSGPASADQRMPQQALFPPSAVAQMAPPIPSETPRPTEVNIMNRRGDLTSSLYQICLNLRRRMAEVPGFEVHMLEMEEEEAEANDSTDPVTSMWNCLRRGYPLMTIYNALKPKVPLEVDASKLPEAKLAKAATFKFLQACLTDLQYPASECFLITDLYGGDTTGFVKVTKVVNRVLDLLERRGLLLHTESQNSNGDSEETPRLTYRQNVVKEIVTSERDYVQFLELLQSFKKELEERGSVAGDALHDIFMNLNALLDFQRRFLIRIEQQNSLPESQQNWGQLFIQYKDSFRVYEPFIANQVRCQSTVNKEWERIKAAPISEDLRGMIEGPNILLGFLLKPFQRLSKYPMLLDQLRRKGGLDEERRNDLSAGSTAATSILQRANEAIAKEQRLAAVGELQNRVEDWKGHQIDHFGELLLFGDYTVVKGEGAKEVEREVRIRVLFSTIAPECRMMVKAVAGQTTRLSNFLWSVSIVIHWRTLGFPKKIKAARRRSWIVAAVQSFGISKFCLFPGSGASSPRTPKRFVNGLEEVPEEASIMTDDKHGIGSSFTRPSARAEVAGNYSNIQATALVSPALRSQRSRLQMVASLSTSLPASPLVQPSPSDGKGSEGFSAPPTPSRRGREDSTGKLADFSTKLRLQGLKVRKRFDRPENPSLDPSYYSYLLWNGPLKSETHLLSLSESQRSNPELDFCLEHELTNPVKIQYKVYLFERILLCCKEINMNKPKNKMLGNSNPRVDRKGKPRLQLKGRIFMQNVTDVLTVVKSEKADYKIQIFWKGDPGVENFVIKFLNEVDMNTWRDQVQLQKKTLSESARSSGPTASDTEFVSMRDQTLLKNPYIDDEEDEDDSQAPTLLPGSSLSTSRNASSNSLRSAGVQLNGSSRAPPPRFPMPDAAAYQPPLSLQTHFPPGTNSPGEFAGNSYFSPGGDSPMSTRSSQTSGFAFSRQNTPRLSNEDGKHRTAPAMARAPSRDGTRPINGYTLDGRTVMRPSLPVMAGPQNAQQQLAMTQQSRMRSASTPDIQAPNNTGHQRYANGQLRPNIENIPVPPIPPHMTQLRAPIVRSQTSSPTNGSLSARNNTQSTTNQRDRAQRQTTDQTSYDQQMQMRLDAIPITETRRYQEGTYADASLQVMKSSPAQAPLASGDSAPNYPTQLKVKIRFDPAPSHVTIVVPIIIKHRSLIDRIDSKMTKVSTASISKNTARLRYRDEEGDLVTIKTDDDVQMAIDDWAQRNDESIRKTIYPDFELFWQPMA